MICQRAEKSGAAPRRCPWSAESPVLVPLGERVGAGGLPRFAAEAWLGQFEDTNSNRLPHRLNLQNLSLVLNGIIAREPAQTRKNGRIPPFLIALYLYQ